MAARQRGGVPLYKQIYTALLEEINKGVYDDSGYISIPERPGLGIEVSEEKVRRAAAEGHNWKNPKWRNADGTVAEW